MARTSRIDKEEIKRLLLETNEAGFAKYSAELVGGMVGCKRQYISQVKRDFEKEGIRFPKLNLRDFIPRSTTPKKERKPRAEKRKRDSGDGLKDLKYDDLEQIGINMYKRALEHPELTERINRLENQLAAEKNARKIAEDKLMKQSISRAEFEVAKRDGKTFSKMEA